MNSNQLFNLKGKTALITGASSGLGEQFAKALSEAGCRVILTARRLDKLEKISSSLENSMAIEMDVSDKNSITNTFDKLEKANEKIDICICNAGVGKLTPIFPDEENLNFEDVIQTNLMGVWYTTKAAAGHMKSHNIEGSIITIGSINGSNMPPARGTAYAVSKAGVSHLTKVLVAELSPVNIRINCISPGWFNTPMTDGPIRSKAGPRIPYGKFADPSDMDGLVLYLASNNASRYVTGSTFTIDGGVSSIRHF